MIIHFKELEKEYPELKGIFIGGCIKRGEGSSFRAKAHAHCFDNDKYKGWICVRSLKRVYKPETKEPSNLIMHELAHIITKHGHDDKWRKQMIEFNQPLKKQYWKKVKVFCSRDKRLSTYKLVNPRNYL